MPSGIWPDFAVEDGTRWRLTLSVPTMSVSPSELANQLGSTTPPVLLDVREPEEHAFVHLPGSILIPLSELAERADELNAMRDRSIVVYCHHGVRSAHAIGLLRTLGFTRLWNLSGGIDRYSLEVDPGLPRY